MSEAKASPCAVEPEVWAAHADAGRTTYTVGSPPKWTAFLARGPAEAVADERGLGLFRWEGRHGHQVEIHGHEMEAEA